MTIELRRAEEEGEATAAAAAAQVAAATAGEEGKGRGEMKMKRVGGRRLAGRRAVVRYPADREASGAGATLSGVCTVTPTLPLTQPTVEPKTTDKKGTRALSPVR